MVAVVVSILGKYLISGKICFVFERIDLGVLDDATQGQGRGTSVLRRVTSEFWFGNLWELPRRDGGRMIQTRAPTKGRKRYIISQGNVKPVQVELASAFLPSTNLADDRQWFNCQAAGSIVRLRKEPPYINSVLSLGEKNVFGLPQERPVRATAAQADPR